MRTTRHGLPVYERLITVSSSRLATSASDGRTGDDGGDEGEEEEERDKSEQDEGGAAPARAEAGGGLAFGDGLGGHAADLGAGAESGSPRG